MSDTQFFVRGRNKGNERKIILSSATLLVGKAPTKEKRIKLKIRMPLSGQGKVVGIPEWIVNAMTFVQQSHDIVTPQAEFHGFTIAFSDDSLFAKTVEVPKCSLRKFMILETGDSEQPDVEMQFSVYAPFATKFWNWCGQMGGEEFWAQFVQVVEAEPNDLELTGDEEEEFEEVGDVAEG